MQPSRPSKRRTWLRLLPMLLGLILVAVACAPSTVAPLSTGTPGAVATQTPASQAPASPPAADSGSQDAGPSLAKNPAAAATKHYKGDPNASVVIIEISDFQ